MNSSDLRVAERPAEEVLKEGLHTLMSICDHVDATYAAAVEHVST